MEKRTILQRFVQWLVSLANNDIVSRRIGSILSVAAILSGIATYLVLTQSGNFEDKSGRVLPLIYLDLTLMMLLAVVIAKRLIELWAARKRGSAGSKLHVQIAALFAFVAITPGICVTVFSALFFNVGVKAWFSEPVRQALAESKIVAQSYVEEHYKSIVRDALAIKQQLVPQIHLLEEMPELLSDRLTELTQEKDLDEAIIYNSRQEVVSRSFLTFALEFEKVLSDLFEEANSAEGVLLPSEDKERIRFLVKIDDDTGLYLYVGKKIDPEVLKHITQTNSAIREYERLDAQQSGLQITFILFFSVVALLLLLASIWAGLVVANLFVRPISRLIGAAEEATKGNLDVQVSSEGSMNNELGSLSLAFNRMIRQLSNQRQDLIKASVQIDQRRQFMETILSRISAGVICMDKSGFITLMNRRANELLHYNGMNITQTRDIPSTLDRRENLLKSVPELLGILDEFDLAGEEVLSRQISIFRKGTVRTLQVAVVLDQSMRENAGYILTFDDVSPLLAAQRKAAWSDVARKIAHEIKNPLTPIQLAAERLKRKYLKEINSDPSTFQSCIDTIIRQVGQIGKLVTEFSSFARLPEPVMRSENAVDLVKQSLFLQREAHPEITFELDDIGEPDIALNCDANQVGQVLTNLLQNAINAVTLEEFTKSKPFHRASHPPLIQVGIEKLEGKCRITIEDNGPGLPIKGRERLTEPYYTTHEKGTGLGLAIVAKIIDDHRGKLELADSHLGGAKVAVELPIFVKRVTE